MTAPWGPTHPSQGPPPGHAPGGAWGPPVGQGPRPRGPVAGSVPGPWQQQGPAPWTAPGSGGPQGPAPKKKSTARTCLTIFLVTAVVAALAIGGIVGWAWWDYETRFGLRRAPNESRLQAFPQGAPPAALGAMMLTSYAFDGRSDAKVAEYDDPYGKSVRFQEYSPTRWNVTGQSWQPHGDMLCLPGHSARCAMKFSDVVLFADAMHLSTEELAKTTDAYLAGKRGEAQGDDWAGVPPPHANALKPIAPMGGLMPQEIKTGPSTSIRRNAAAPAKEQTFWEITYGAKVGPVYQIQYTAHKGRSIWGFVVGAGGIVQYGNVLCRPAPIGSVCALAGSDGVIVGQGTLDVKLIAEQLQR